MKMPFLDEISKFLLVIVIGLIIFMAGIQVGRKLQPRAEVRTVDAEQGKTTIQITIG
jgi:hypothetical protein